MFTGLLDWFCYSKSCQIRTNCNDLKNILPIDWVVGLLLNQSTDQRLNGSKWEKFPRMRGGEGIVATRLWQTRLLVYCVVGRTARRVRVEQLQLWASKHKGQPAAKHLCHCWHYLPLMQQSILCAHSHWSAALLQSGPVTLQVLYTTDRI